LAASFAAMPRQDVEETDAREASTSGGAATEPGRAMGPLELQVTVETGDRRGAGTVAAVDITLVGTTGAVATLHIPGRCRDGEELLPRGSKVTFPLVTDRDLGQIAKIQVKRRNLDSALDKHMDGGWFLEQVSVSRPSGAGQATLTFPCHAWFGEDSEGVTEGVQERNLVPSKPGSELGLEGMEGFRFPRPLSARISATVIPHQDKVAAGMRAVNRRNAGHGGEDAYFNTETGGVIGLGVADGVYAWRHRGIDSGEMSRALMEEARWAIEHGVRDPLLVLGNAWYKTFHANVQGSSTATVLVIDRETGLLKSSLLGDSGYMILSRRDLRGHSKERTRAGQRYYERFRSPQQEHHFGYPYQLGHHDNSDRPEDALNLRQRVVPGDVVVLGTDGLFDNLHSEEVVACVNGLADAGKRLAPAAVSQELARRAFQVSLDRTIPTPYSIAASAQFDMVFSGGKKDDICIVVAVLE